MKKIPTCRQIGWGAALIAAASLAACGGDDHASPPAGTAVQYTQFSAFVKSTYALAANTTPIEINDLQFSFDVQDDPTAFDGLLM